MTPQQVAELWAAWLRSINIACGFALHVVRAEARLMKECVK